MAGKVLGAATVKLGLSANPLFRGIGRVSQMMGGLGSSMLPIIGIATAVGVALAGVGLAIGASKLIGKGIRLANEFEQTRVAMEVLLGSVEDTKFLLDELTTFAATTPFQFQGLANAARQLTGFGFSAKEVLITMGPLGDLAAGTGSAIGDMTEIFGRMKIAGRVSMEEIRRLSDRGVPIMQMLADVMGVTTGEVRKLVEEGKIGFPEVTRALAILTDEGGQFAGMMDAQSQTITGLMSTLKDNVEVPLREIGQSFIETFNVQERLTGLISFIQRVAPAVVGTVGGMFQAVSGMLDVVGAAFNGLSGGMFTNTNDIIIALSTLQVWFETLGLRVNLALNKAMLAVVRFADWTKWMVDSAGANLLWLAVNWKQVFVAMAATTFAITRNMKDNLGTFFLGILGWLKGEGFNWEWKSLTDGLEVSLSKMPGLIERHKSPIVAALETLVNSEKSLLDKTTKDRLASLLKERLLEKEITDDGPRKSLLDLLGDDADTGKGKGAKGASFVGLTEAWKSVQASAFKNPNTPENKTAKNTGKTADAAEKTADEAASLGQQVAAIRKVLENGIPARLA